MSQQAVAIWANSRAVMKKDNVELNFSCTLFNTHVGGSTGPYMVIQIVFVCASSVWYTLLITLTHFTLPFWVTAIMTSLFVREWKNAGWWYLCQTLCSILFHPRVLFQSPVRQGMGVGLPKNNCMYVQFALWATGDLESFILPLPGCRHVSAVTYLQPPVNAVLKDAVASDK